MTHHSTARLAKAGVLALPAVAMLRFSHQGANSSTDPSAFMPHGYCYFWNPGIVWLNVSSDGLIAVSYYAIPLILIYFIRKNRTLAFNGIFWMFASFILACGATHAMEVWNVWHGDYLLAGILKSLTAAVSVLTAAMLVPLVPKALAMADAQAANLKLEGQLAERYRSEAAIAQALKDLADQKFALDQHGIVATTDVRGTITYVNDKFCAISGYSRDELLGQNHRILNSGHHSKEFFQELYRTIANGEVWHGEICNRAKNGWLYWVATTIVPFAGADGKPRQYVAIRADITERKRSEEALSESLAASRMALKELADQKFALDQHAIVATTDVQGTITYVNDKFCAISGYSRDELLGQNHRILNSGHHPKEFFQQMYHTIAKGQVWREEVCNRAKDGSIYWVDTSVVPFLDAYGKPRQYLAIRGDITARKRAEEVRERLASIVESSDDAIISKNLSGIITAWNRGAEKVFGYSASEAVGKPLLMLLPLERQNEESDILARLQAGESVEHFETVRVRKDGLHIDVSVTISPIRDSHGTIVGASKITRDITDQKRTEEALRESQERFQAMANGIPQLAWMAEADGKIFWFNQRWYDYSGTTFEQMENGGWKTLHDPYILPKVLDRWEISIATGQPFDMEFPLRGADGKFRMFLTRIRPVKDAEGRVVRWFGTNTDISERQEAEDRLALQAEELSRQSEELIRSQHALEAQTRMLKLVLESIGEGLVAADSEGKFLIWNDAANQLLNRSISSLPPEEWSSHYGCFLPDGITCCPTDQLPLVRALRGESMQNELVIRHPESRQDALLEFNARPMKDAQGTLIGGVVAFRDITQRKAAEKKIHELNQDLEARVIVRTAELEHANRELESFTYSVSHDLRAPLRHIGGFSRILMEEFGPGMGPEAQRHLQRIEDGVRRMGLLVDELLNLARVGRHSVKLRATKLNPLIDEVVSLLQPDLENRKVIWKIAELPEVQCDPVLIRQVFQNLIANALKFTRPRACALIEINGTQQDDKLVIRVLDNGVGFDMKYADKLFGVFQRLHRAEDFEGTGVGLATVQRLVQKHGGRAWAEAEVGKGAAFFFSLDLSRSDLARSDQAKSDLANNGSCKSEAEPAGLAAGGHS